MATKLISQLTEALSAVGDDWLEIEIAASGLSRKIKKSNLVGAILTGGGAIATGGNGLTIGGTSTINGSLVGNMSGGGTFATGGNTLTLGSSGTLALGGFTFTVPATGTAALLGAAQTFSQLQTFGAGISLGNETLSTYDQGTFTPVVADATTGGNLATGSFSGWFTKIGHRVWVDVRLENINITGLTGANSLQIRNMPFAAQTATGYVASAPMLSSFITHSGDIVAFITSGSSIVNLANNVSNNTFDTLSISDVFSSGFTDIWFSLSYITA